MKLTLVSLDSDLVRVQCEGNISQDTFKVGEDPLEGLLGANCYKHTVLLNLEKTHYIDSSGVSWLMSRHKNFLQAGGKLVLYSIPPMVSQVLHLLRMSLILDMAADENA